MKRIPRICYLLLAIALSSCNLPVSTPATGTSVVPTAPVATIPPTSASNPPASPAAEQEAEVSLPNVEVSADGSVIRISIAILNHGGAFTLSMGDVALTQKDGAPLAMTSSEPALPIEVAAGAEQVFQFVFPRPATPTATLKVLNTEYTIEGY